MTPLELGFWSIGAVLLLIAAKIVYSANRVKVRYSIHDTRVPRVF